MSNVIKWTSAIAGVLIVGACGLGNIGGPPTTEQSQQRDDSSAAGRFANSEINRGTSIFDAFRRSEEELTVRVNRYIWTATLEVLDFLPIQDADPFTGVIVTGFGTAPGGSRAYKATVLIRDPALDARSLNVALQTQRGPADAATVRAIEDAILTRARQLRQQDNRF